VESSITIPISDYSGAVFNDGVVGKAVKGPICTYQYSGGVNMVSTALS
jgi:hypothetical protein